MLIDIALAASLLLPRALPVDTTGVADVNGTRLYYETRGTGETVVLIHGGFMDSRLWDEHFPRLAERFRVVRYDLRGAGRSQRNHLQPYSPAEDLRALLDFLGESRVHVVGLSRGGAIALDFVLRFPQRVQTLVVAEPALPGLQMLLPAEAQSAATLPSMAEIARVARSGEETAALELILQHPPFTKVKTMPAKFAFLRGLIADNAHLLAGGDLEQFLSEPRIAQRLSQIGAPVLAIAGDVRAESYPGQVHAALAQGIRNVTAVKMAGAGHFPNLEQPDEFHQLVMGFLTRAPATAR